MASKSNTHATTQFLITLQEVPDKVDDLVGLAAHRFLDVFGSDVAYIRTGTVGGAHYISDLVVRGLAQPRNKQRISTLLDRLLELGVDSVDAMIKGAARRKPKYRSNRTTKQFITRTTPRRWPPPSSH